MSAKMPTLWVARRDVSDPLFKHAGRRTPAYSAPHPGLEDFEVAYVPASALDAAYEALRLERAEVERLRATMRRVAASMGHSGGENPEYLPCNESCTDCDDETIGEKHRPDLPEDRCSDHPDAESDTECWRCLLRAALTPRPGAKES